MSDFEKWPDWTDSVRAVKRLDKGPAAPGSRVIVWQPKFPPALWTITRLEPGREFVWVSRGPGFSVIAAHEVETRDRGSRVTLSLRFVGPLGGLFGQLTRSINERYIAMEADGLRQRSEAVAQQSLEQTVSS